MNHYYNTAFIVWVCRIELGHFKSTLGDSHVATVENYVFKYKET